MAKKKKAMLMLSCLLALVVVGGIFAYFTSENSIDNQLQTKKYGTELIEEFTPKGDWQPGMAVTKKVGVQNTGDYPLFVRIWMEESWTTVTAANNKSFDSSEAAFTSATAATSTQGNPTDGLTSGDQSVVFKKLNDGGASNWMKGTDGYWYWKVPLAPGASTTNLLDEITLAADADMGEYDKTNYYTTMSTRPGITPADITGDPATGWATYTGSVPAGATFNRSVSGLKAGNEGYAGATYVLTVKSQVLQGTKEAFDGTSTWQTAPADVKTGWGI